ncbi:uncharacterized protein LOC115886327 [Sitophilus oryzae]|uniref:Uncharacterized protein LOC115886327 n=1 Tax=Sitophilus oryzae TaxID=7048 RepID=A0A6J2YD52_SITOR|nr:uncharacterized protein LOC115886327 [Sitophilus oryzae]
MSVTIYYGPYFAHGVIKHRIQKINGLFAELTDLGYEVEVIEINQYNRVEIKMFDRIIFRCDIRNLMFNMACEDDPVCQIAVKAVEEAKTRMARLDEPAESEILIRDVKGLSFHQGYSTSDLERGSSSGHWPTSRQKIISKQNLKVSKVTIQESKNQSFDISHNSEESGSNV